MKRIIDAKGRKETYYPEVEVTGAFCPICKRRITAWDEVRLNEKKFHSCSKCGSKLFRKRVS
jgi:Zn ribbon nucleic-acid-binding protein